MNADTLQSPIEPAISDVPAAPLPQEKAPKGGKKEKSVKKQTKRGVGPGTKRFKFKAVRKAGECDVLGCSRSPSTTKARRCLKHKKLIRKEQLKANNVVWRKRVQKGTAGHHIVYTSPKEGKTSLTEWARANPERAMKLVKKDFGTVDLDGFRKLAKLAADAADKAAKKAKVKARKSSTA